MALFNVLWRHRFRRFLNWALAIFGVLGGIVTVVQIYQWWVPQDLNTVFWRVEETSIFNKPRSFDLHAYLGSSIISGGDIAQSEITIFRRGGKPIAAEQLRRPFSITLPSGSKLLALKIEAVQSDLPDNFQATAEGDTVTVRWKFFDPDMALKLVLLRSGSLADPEVQRI